MIKLQCWRNKLCTHDLLLYCFIDSPTDTMLTDHAAVHQEQDATPAHISWRLNNCSYDRKWIKKSACGRLKLKPLHWTRHFFLFSLTGMVNFVFTNWLYSTCFEEDDTTKTCTFTKPVIADSKFRRYHVTRDCKEHKRDRILPSNIAWRHLCTSQ